MYCNGLKWAVLGSTGLYWEVLGCNLAKLCWTVLDCVGYGWVCCGMKMYEGLYCAMVCCGMKMYAVL